jgi:hypothetical protein
MNLYNEVKVKLYPEILEVDNSYTRKGNNICKKVNIVSRYPSLVHHGLHDCRIASGELGGEKYVGWGIPKDLIDGPGEDNDPGR